MTDLFTTPELIPEQIKEILSQDAESYEELHNINLQCIALGYMFDINLHCEPYNLRRICE